MQCLRSEGALLVCALLLSAVAAASADPSPMRETICSIFRLPAQDLMQVDHAAMPSASAGGSTCVANDKSSAVHSIKVAVGYCIDRCYQQFDYCHHRQEQHEHCVRRLAACLANC